MTADTALESAPLLGRDAPRPRGGSGVTALLTACMFLVALGVAMPGLPTLHVLQDIICRRRVLGAGEWVDDKLCKGADVQAELSFVIAMLSMFEAIPGLVFGFPYGLLADKIGRRPVLALSVLGMTCTVAWSQFVLYNIDSLGNVRIVWTAYLWPLIGGGRHVMMAMFFSMIADVEPADRLSDAFFMLIVSLLGANLSAVFLSAQLMRIDPWIPMLLGLGILICGGLIIFFIPETLQFKPRPGASCDGQSTDNTPFLTAFKSRFSSLRADLGETATLLHSYPVAALLLTFVTTGYHSRSLEFAPQYLSKNLGWTFSDAGMLLSSQVVLNIALYMFIIPAASRLLMSPRAPFRLPPAIKDLFLARASGVALALGALLFALPSTVAAVLGLMIFTLGLGFSTLCRVVVTALVDKDRTARLYTLISVVSGLGELSAGPAIAWLFSVGLGLGDGLAGLPYLGVAGLCGVAALCVFTVRQSAFAKDGEEEETGEEA